jgi:hypothetical protein
MKIRHLFCIASMTAALACGGDDGSDTGADTGDTDPTATMTDPTATMTDPTATMTDPTATMTDPTATMTDPTATMTDPTATDSSSDDATADSGSTDATADSSGSDSGTTGEPSAECQTYCGLYLENCDDGQGGSTPYADEDECFGACAGFSEEGLGCRIGHLDGSAVGEPDPDEDYYNNHCPHGSADGAGVCN